MTLVRFNNKPGRVMYPEFFNGVMENFFNDQLWNEPATTRPLSNVKEGDKGFEVEFALPGFGKSDVEVDVNNHVLTVTGKKEERKSEEKENYSRREFYYGDFTRSFSLPESVDEEAIKASFKDGILKVEIPKKPELQPKALKIAVK